MSAELAKDLYAKFDELGTVGVQWYSGRGMMGKECLGITGTWQDVQGAMAEVLLNEHDRLMSEASDSEDPVDSGDYHDTVEALMDFSFDNMGLDVVVYFKNLQRPEEDEDEAP